MVIALISVSAVLFADQFDSAYAGSQSLWISNSTNPNSFISELAHDQLQRSGIPTASLNTGRSNVGQVGKLTFDSSGNLWIPFCGNGHPITGIVAAFSPPQLAQFAAGNNHVRPKVELTGTDLNCPSALAFDRNGNLWIANYGFADNNVESIVELPAAALFSKHPAPSTKLASNSFEELDNITFDPAGDLWFASQLLPNLYEFTPDQLSQGGMQSPALVLQSPTFNDPTDMTFDVAGNLWVTYYANNQSQNEFGGVQMFASADLTGSGTISPPAAVSFGGQKPCSVLTICAPSSLAFDQAGNLWVGQTYTISEFTPAQLASGNPSLANLILAANFRKGGRRLGLNSENFLGPGFLTFGPATK